MQQQQRKQREICLLKNAIKDYVNCIQIYAFSSSLPRTDPPQVTLSLGSTLRPDDIKEGDDVYFECHIKANPKEHRITWSHDVSFQKYQFKSRKSRGISEIFTGIARHTKRLLGHHHLDTLLGATTCGSRALGLLCLRGGQRSWWDAECTGQLENTL